jgi:hypothetical protein
MMTDRKSSDEMAAIASRITSRGDPLQDNALLDQIVRNVADAFATGTIEDARAAIREPLKEFLGNARSLAASVMSQADGPEARRD